MAHERIETDVSVSITLQTGGGRPPVDITKLVALRDESGVTLAQTQISLPAINADFTTERLSAINAVLAPVGLVLEKA